MSMSESNEQTNQDSAPARTAASKARRTTAKATAPASKAASKAAAKTDDTASAAKNATKDVTERSAKAVSGAAQTAAKGVEVGRQTVVAASGQAAAVAKTAWTVVAQRKLIAAGVGAGLTVLSVTSYAAGRRAGRHTLGPITRMTGGRI
ncbi:hypothetical protein ACFYZI_29385 [Streptomyces griseorubiginosus]|uniref:Uncharacterized protein n=1 Tax=Streptomyces griseorubiginosus TaxID=67304 RepID=A0A101RW93_9ACTN|nr:hypothetical protein [Streptomyces griseorubiginosus]KUN62898.1 hypothetical protein AQJ54_28335 [Streptomyces griseorubiginosus]